MEFQRTKKKNNNTFFYTLRRCVIRYARTIKTLFFLLNPVTNKRYNKDNKFKKSRSKMRTGTCTQKIISCICVQIVPANKTIATYYQS